MPPPVPGTAGGSAFTIASSLIGLQHVFLVYYVDICNARRTQHPPQLASPSLLSSAGRRRKLIQRTVGQVEELEVRPQS